jgi:hypothetical protein
VLELVNYNKEFHHFQSHLALALKDIDYEQKAVHLLQDGGEQVITM